ncbi:hypothetical protein [Chromobacterium vaccinii]|uniref:hypothetical protein n=1 Tax=Chromobacterium vaccinii TaxID=1108595 RepID=UPI00118513EA|nr:hypothetical protein [Chromobacterium vaccinii]
MSKYDSCALVRRVIDAGSVASVASFRLNARLNGGSRGAARLSSRAMGAARMRRADGLAGGVVAGRASHAIIQDECALKYRVGALARQCDVWCSASNGKGGIAWKITVLDERYLAFF